MPLALALNLSNQPGPGAINTAMEWTLAVNRKGNARLGKLD